MYGANSISVSVELQRERTWKHAKMHESFDEKSFFPLNIYLLETGVLCCFKEYKLVGICSIQTKSFLSLFVQVSGVFLQK